jgi:two-component system sensor histidine kinase CpxA
MISRVTAAKPSIFSMRYGIARVAMRLKGSNGHEYIFATELPAGPRAAFGMNGTAIALQWGVALLVSGLICYLLTRYLTAPILRLREASQQLAAGDLSIRAVGVERRRDELGDLVRDFNAMASRIEELVSRQRQLISDVSHELRSPLARLYVALDLGRERKGNDPAFDHMEKDIGLLNEMIGRLLAVARLDSSAPPVAMASVNLSETVSQIVRDADFESRERNGNVVLTMHDQVLVQGDPKLLKSAIENVVRNAIAYTEPGTSVEVLLQSEHRSSELFARLSVRDYGPGVPEAELVNIFQPFYRVSDARDRQSGGAGLGLAIAEGVIRVHGGTIRAENVTPRGLQVEILLPQLSWNSTNPTSSA